MNIHSFDRRAFLLKASALALAFDDARGSDLSKDPWSSSELMKPAELARELDTRGNSTRIICVTFPILYQQRHIRHAIIAGPGNKPAGIEKLLAAVAAVPHNAPIVIYCGCCPMDKCPNIRPAYLALKKRGFDPVRVLNLPSNFHTDWAAKGYAVESS